MLLKQTDLFFEPKIKKASHYETPFKFCLTAVNRLDSWFLILIMACVGRLLLQVQLA
jgi:hypothetical protein